MAFFFGFGFSGVTTAWQFVPTPWGRVAQFLPVAGLSTALRSVAFFGGARDGFGLVVLAAWAVAGFALCLLVSPTARKARPRNLA